MSIFRIFSALFAWALLSLGSCSAHSFRFSDYTVTVDPTDPNIMFEGRYKALDDGKKQFDAPGVTIHVGVTGATKVDILLESHELNTPNRFSVIVDGKLTSTVIDTQNVERDKVLTLTVATDLRASRTHAISVVKVTEANFNVPNTTALDNYLTFHGFVLDQGSTTALPKSITELQARRIEFIGDDVTTGYCDLCEEVRQNGGYQSQSFARAWPYLTARALNASFHASGKPPTVQCCWY
jgi:hypothetical protein